MKICLIGSTRFMDQFLEANRRLSAAGHVVYSVAFATTSENQDQVTSDQKSVLDAVHLRKIIESDLVMLVGRMTDGAHYIGESTRREIIFAHVMEKRIQFWSPDCEKVRGPQEMIESFLKLAGMTESEIDAMEFARQSAVETQMKQFLGGIGMEIDSPPKN